jgi:hypothetical protein
MQAMQTVFTDPAVKAVFDSYPIVLRKKLLALRQLILDTAASTEGVGTLVDTFRSLFPNTFDFEGNRALVFDASDTLPKKELAFCIAMALTYHVDKLTSTS